MSTFTEKREAAKAAVESMHSQIAEQLHTGADWVSYLDFARRFHRYSPNNVMWMWAQWEQRKRAIEIGRAIEVGFFGAPVTPVLPELTLTAGFSKWKDMGGMVRKGEKALSVLAPFTITDKDDLDENGKPRKKVIGFVLKNRTFDISQVDGVERPAESPVKLLTGDGPDGLWDGLVALAEHNGYSVSVVPVPGSANGRCIYGPKLIEIEVANEGAQRVKTLAHEIGHMLMHDPSVVPSRLPTDVIEVEAESVAYSVLASFGVDSADYSFGYVGAWSEGNGQKMAATLERVADCTARISTFLTDGTLPDAKEVKFYKDSAAQAGEAA